MLPTPPARWKDPESERAGRSLTEVLRATLAVRGLGPTSLRVAQVGSGHIDAFWQYGHDAANLTGAALIAREAGAVVTDTEGGPWSAGSAGFLAAAPSLHTDFLAVLARAEAEPSGVR